MKNEIPPIIVIPVVVVVLGLLIYFGFRAMSPPTPGGGYTPGVPPWKDPQTKAAYASGKAQPWRSANDWHPANQTAPAVLPTSGLPGVGKQ